MSKQISKIQNSINFWWILSITLFIFSLTFFGISVYIYNNYFSDNANEIIDDNAKLNNLIESNYVSSILF